MNTETKLRGWTLPATGDEVDPTTGTGVGATTGTGVGATTGTGVGATTGAGVAGTAQRWQGADTATGVQINRQNDRSVMSGDKRK